MNTPQTFTTGNGSAGKFYSLPALEAAGIGKVSKLPVSIRIVLESLLRNMDGKKVTEADVKKLTNWNVKSLGDYEIPFKVARIVLQDFTGVPLLVDLVAMRFRVKQLGKNPKMVEPLVPVDFVVDHSVQADFAGTQDALNKNLNPEFERNKSFCQFLKWGEQTFDTFKVVPPGIGIVHQVNLEYLAKGVPASLVGTDSHTTMINGLRVGGQGVGALRPRRECQHNCPQTLPGLGYLVSRSLHRHQRRNQHPARQPQLDHRRCIQRRTDRLPRVHVHAEGDALFLQCGVLRRGGIMHSEKRQAHHRKAFETKEIPSLLYRADGFRGCAATRRLIVACTAERISYFNT